MMINNKTNAIEVLPKTAANTSIIWLHGLGASGDDFLPIVNQFNLPDDLQIRFIFPHAPIRPISINNGMKMRAWYDVKNFDESIYYDNHNHEGLKESQLIINELIEQEINYGIAPNKIVLAGFSQGGVAALHTGLRFDIQLAGIICLSGYLPWHSLLATQRSLANQATQIFMAHGLFDPVVPINLGKNSYDALVNLNYNVSWNTYVMQHAVVDQEIIDIETFFKKILIL